MQRVACQHQPCYRAGAGRRRRLPPLHRCVQARAHAAGCTAVPAHPSAAPGRRRWGTRGPRCTLGLQGRAGIRSGEAAATPAPSARGGRRGGCTPRRPHALPGAWQGTRHGCCHGSHPQLRPQGAEGAPTAQPPPPPPPPTAQFGQAVDHRGAIVARLLHVLVRACAPGAVHGWLEPRGGRFVGGLSSRRPRATQSRVLSLRGQGQETGECRQALPSCRRAGVLAAAGRPPLPHHSAPAHAGAWRAGMACDSQSGVQYEAQNIHRGDSARAYGR